MESSVSKGRNLVFAAMGIIIGISMVTIFFNLITGVHQSFVVQFIRFVLTCGLCYLVYSGVSWARWVCVILMGIACFLGLSGVLSIIDNPLLGLVSFLYFAAYLTVILLLLIPKSVGEYFESLELKNH